MQETGKTKKRDMKKIAVILSGSGVYDGSEIHEAVLTLLAIAQHGAVCEIFAPDRDQYHVINHLTGEEMDESRNVLIESARIARGRVRDLADFDPQEFDGLILPGGFGVAKNLSDYAFLGATCNVVREVELAVRSMAELSKPIGALCIAPVLIARILGQVKITLGDDLETIKNVEDMGATHHTTGHGEIVVDEQNKVVTSPCYMLDADITQVALGADKVVKALLDLM